MPEAASAIDLRECTVTFGVEDRTPSFLHGGLVQRISMEVLHPTYRTISTPGALEIWRRYECSEKGLFFKIAERDEPGPLHEEKNHFRRIGATEFLAFSPKPDYPSRQISSANDDQVKWWRPVNQGEPRDKSSWKRYHEEHYPLHFHILVLFNEPAESYVRSDFAENPETISKKDEQGFTPVYLAAAVFDIPALRALLELGSDLNVGGTDEEFLRRDSWDCTCRRCVGGWLSPRLSWRIQDLVVRLYEQIPLLVEIRPNVTKTLYDGRRILFDVVSQVLLELGGNVDGLATTTELTRRPMDRVSGKAWWDMVLRVFLQVLTYGPWIPTSRTEIRLNSGWNVSRAAFPNKSGSGNDHRSLGKNPKCLPRRWNSSRFRSAPMTANMS
ncbi:hypothetical protein OBBRIDRAFT_883992 [Obba rivulosa]|uniref:Uncharacterized protein n=1 Tax=Obba rivulosa TaxID=1052685 RepID=A0A8E2DTA6_9APHY|nr:hypothetical protein OBBRIDRAFT_883992 [Obba rivulosa]